MADKNTSASQELIDNGATITINKDRSELAIIAAAEIEALCGVLRAATKDCCGIDYTVRGLSARIEDLSIIVMGALGDENDTTKDLTRRLMRERGETAAA